ncbi:hypothetical protein AYI69_g10067 [Smittium culicis]|uniref:Uncharacterized protein n=1 Tax=Smittium culicis TaxID=133412 RepID=A0A1R1X8D8_9FUNG|nr:hypothetical protein AYI69_g10067 [Smittium culicis]
MLSDPDFSALINTKVSKSIEALEIKQVIEFVPSEVAEVCGGDVVVGGIVVAAVPAQPDMRGLSLKQLCENGSKAALFAMEVTSVDDTRRTFKAKHLAYTSKRSTSSTKFMRVDGADKLTDDYEIEGEVALDFSLAISFGDCRTVTVGDSVYAANTTIEQLQIEKTLRGDASRIQSIPANQHVNLGSETDHSASLNKDAGISSVDAISGSDNSIGNYSNSNSNSNSNCGVRLIRATVARVNLGRGLIAASFSDPNVNTNGIISEFDTNLFVAANSVPKPFLALLQ